MDWGVLAFIALLILVAGYFVTRETFNLRRWIFIMVLFFLFMMVCIYGAQFASEKFCGPEPEGWEARIEWNEEKELTEGITLVGFGILGLVLLVVFHTRETLELGMSFGLAGCISTVTGLILVLEKGPAGTKFAAAAMGVVILSFLMYKYRKQIIGE
jgi:tellurite resistance protein TehA-like permease